ncbi:uncharacterized protein VDAG_06141 [Verticillium dahliae VdLs.17]|uniref:Integral membrane protein n=1 Tax=Verticillium dahliae (strain VdLs.17 / ATCC MYA-4575 / FGSC 10137) TaxID=498257 RepID=G2X8K0_VERDV|nr:uncharacterized protein VDAG_06141 [Verticillium dahliae VdLs.17]EGY15287.1 integral membrane protein [Verticillium dahliae VdLs.17]
MAVEIPETVPGLLALIPQCAMACVMDTIQVGNCSIASIKSLEECICPSIVLQSALSDCVQLSCHFEDQVKAVGVEAAVCAAYPRPSRSKEVKTIAMVFTVVTFPIVGLRFLSRWTATSGFWWDDWTVLAAIVFLAGLAGIEIASAELGFGMHYWHVSPENGTILLQLFYAVQMLYILIQVFAKMSILLFFSRIFQVRWFLVTVRAFIAFLILHGLLFVLLVAFQCMPVSSVWDRSNDNRTCINMTAVGYAGAAFSIIEDLVIRALICRRKKAKRAEDLPEPKVLVAGSTFRLPASLPGMGLEDLLGGPYEAASPGTLSQASEDEDANEEEDEEEDSNARPTRATPTKCPMCDLAVDEDLLRTFSKGRPLSISQQINLLALPPLVLKLSKFVRHHWSQMSTRASSTNNNKSRQSTLSIPGSKGFEKMPRSPEEGGYPMSPLSPQGNDKRVDAITISDGFDSGRDLESLSIDRRF